MIFECLSKVVNGPADVACNSWLIVFVESDHECIHHCGQICFLNGRGMEITNTSKSPGSRVFDQDVTISQSLDKNWNRLIDKRSHVGLVGSLKNRTEGKSCRFTEMPVRVFDVLLHEWHDILHNFTSDCIRHQRQARSSSHRHIPGVLILILLLSCHGFQKQWYKILESPLDELLAASLRSLIVVHCLFSFRLQVNFLVTYCGPELYTLLCYLLIVLFDCLECQIE
mmetsp:Transcript_16497/g.27261  ORF Transcript_16497/g.27261 Transcript_16497/m.27261 type:complete len:226 (-) Transcript_16497:881-1558(-)